MASIYLFKSKNCSCYCNLKKEKQTIYLFIFISKIVGTHADDEKCTNEYLQDYIADMQRKYNSRFPNIRKFIVADVTNDVKNVLISIKEIISTQRNMGEPMPLTYLELEKEVIAEREKRKGLGQPPIVAWRDWIKMGNIANITEESTLIRATKLFHELVRFHFFLMFFFVLFNNFF